MSPLLRGGVVVAVLAVSFAAGYFLKPVPVIPTAAAQTPVPPPSPDVPLIAPSMDEQVKPAEAAVEPNDPTLRMIRDSLGIKTTVLDRNEPLPPILADAKGPIPMGGPMPRLEPPPAPVLPMIDPAPVHRPDPAPAVRITIRDAGGHVTTLTTRGRVTIDLIGPDGTLPESGPMPHVAGEPASSVSATP
jgi:hypothetical protein